MLGLAAVVSATGLDLITIFASTTVYRKAWCWVHAMSAIMVVRLGKTAQWCERGQCLVSGYGVCNNKDCEWKGPLDQDCSHCGEGVFAPVPLSHLFSNSAKVILNVVLPTTGLYQGVFQNTEPRFVADDVIASRTQSSG